MGYSDFQDRIEKLPLVIADNLSLSSLLKIFVLLATALRYTLEHAVHWNSVYSILSDHILCY